MAEPSGGAGAAKPKVRSNTLRQTASAVFALTAIVPLLLFLWTVYYLGALSEVQVQVGLGFALTIALLGFAIFRGLMDQMSDLILALRRVLDLRERSSEAVARASAEALGAIEPAAGAGARAAVSPTRPPRPPAPATEPAPPGAREYATVKAVPNVAAMPAPPPARPPERSPAPERAPAPERTSRPAAEPRAVPGFGAIQEVHDLSRAMVVLWQAEASMYMGRRVLVSALRFPRPIVGTLIELTDDGLLVQTDESERIAVPFDRLSGITAEKSPNEQ